MHPCLGPAAAWVPALGRPCALLLLLAAAACLPPPAAAAPLQNVLSDRVLYKLLYDEPNRYLQTLGNVSRARVHACGTGHMRPPPSLPHACIQPNDRLLALPPARLLPPLLLPQISDLEGSLSRTFLSPAHRRAAGRVRRGLQTFLAMLCCACMGLPTGGHLPTSPTPPRLTHCPLQLRRWMAAAGMRTWADAMANVHGRVKGADADSPAIIIGSHYDTVVDGGKYDGALGIIAGISAVKAVLLEAALSRGLVTLEEVEAAAAQKGAEQSIDLSELLYDQQQAAQLISAPVQVLAFSDEEGVRCVWVGGAAGGRGGDGGGEGGR